MSFIVFAKGHDDKEYTPIGVAQSFIGDKHNLRVFRMFFENKQSARDLKDRRHNIILRERDGEVRHVFVETHLINHAPIIETTEKKLALIEECLFAVEAYEKLDSGDKGEYDENESSQRMD